MEIYKTIKKIASNIPKIAAATFIATLPYTCNDGCAYSGSKTYAAEIKQEAREIIQESSNLETILEK